MGFTGNENHTITLEEAAKLTRNYREQAGPGAVKAGFFGKATIQKIIDQDGCVGLRIYYGLEDDGTPAFVLVGVTADGEDLTGGILAERQRPCPPYCDERSPLNT
jgi:hypothetical protein